MPGSMRISIRAVWFIPIFYWVLAAGWGQEAPGTSLGTGSIEGTVSVTAPARPEAKPANEYDQTNAYGSTAYDTPIRNRTKPLPEEIVVYLDRVPGQWNPPAEHVKLDQKYIQFTHRVLPVLAGTVVDFTNHDPVYHNVFSNSEINPFDLGRRQKGERASVRMRHEEVPVRVYCEIHSKMKSSILVLQNPFFKVVKPGESFHLEKVPPGTYTLTAWHDYWQPVKEEVAVNNGAATKVQITLDKVQK